MLRLITGTNTDKGLLQVQFLEKFADIIHGCSLMHFLSAADDAVLIIRLLVGCRGKKIRNEIFPSATMKENGQAKMKI